MLQDQKKMWRSALALIAVAVASGPLLAQTPPDRTNFESMGEDRRAIQALLDTYTRAVSTKDEALFETLLLNTGIPFSDAGSAIQHGSIGGGTQNYKAFRKGVFAGAPFRQTFKHISIRQDGPLAQVSLVFVNTDAAGSSSGWKTLELLKIAGRWKIACEFYT